MANWRKIWVRLMACDGGQSTAEFAIIVPVLLLVVIGIMRFGTLYNNYVQLTNSVDAGAREFAVERGQPDPCQDVLNELENTAAGLNATASGSQITLTAYDGTGTHDSASQATWTYPTDSAAPSSCPWSPSYTTADNTPGELISGDTVEVYWQYPWSLSGLGLKIVSSTMSAQATESIQ